MKKEKYIITNDDDGHWYLIPLRLYQKFNEWVCTDWDLRDKDIDFNSYRIDYPEQVIIETYEIKW